MKVSVSFLSSKNIPEDLVKLNKTDCDYIHVDVMDGEFVPKKTLPFSEMKHISDYTSKRLDVHLMVMDPMKYIPDYAGLNTEFITIHEEIEGDIEECLKKIREYSIKSGLAIKPNTKVDELVQYLPYCDLVLVMSVEPGMGGQTFIRETEKKLEELSVLLDTYKPDCVINVDGGVNDETVQYCSRCDIVTSGSYVTSSDNFQKKISSLRR